MVRAMQPTHTGFAVNPHDGVRTYYEVFGGPETGAALVFLPPWSIVHSRIWKMQAPTFARWGWQVVTFDGRGNGRSDRPARGYATSDFAADARAVLEAVGIERAAFVGFSAGARWAIRLASESPERVTRLVLIGPSIAIPSPTPEERLAARTRFLGDPQQPGDPSEWVAASWRQDYPAFVDWFFHHLFPEPHSTKGIDDGICWGLETGAETLIATQTPPSEDDSGARLGEVQCPVLVLHGSHDRRSPLEVGRRVHAALPNAEMVIFEGSGHVPHVRDPVRTNLVLRDFLADELPRRPLTYWKRAQSRSTKRALFVSSPIGLGHAQRDVAIARELRALVPGLEIEWLAQDPVTRVLAANGEVIHPLSSALAGESAHIEQQMSGEHTLHVFRAWRDMDEILLSNFMLFHDVVREGNYDLWIGDEAWEVDYYLHENPELKTAAYAWLTDFVGWVPAEPDPDGRDPWLTADYNAEMIAQVERYPRVRDAAIFIGDPDDIIPDRFGEGLPYIRAWTERHYQFSGYITPFDPAALPPRTVLREKHGLAADALVAVASVGGTRVGLELLQRILQAWPIILATEPDARLIVVRGPRIDEDELPPLPGVEYRGYVHNLYELLAAADIALVQGGLSTTMELVAAGRPFLYFPLTAHCEQNRHVAWRLERYGVPPERRITYAAAQPEIIAERFRAALSAPVAYRNIQPGGARRAAERIAALL